MLKISPLVNFNCNVYHRPEVWIYIKFEGLCDEDQFENCGYCPGKIPQPDVCFHKITTNQRNNHLVY